MKSSAKYVIQFVGTLILLVTIPDNLIKTFLLLGWWFLTFQPLEKKEWILFLLGNISFSILDWISLKHGLFQFLTPNLGPMPYFEFFMWGYYSLFAWRILKEKIQIPAEIEPKVSLLNLVFTGLFMTQSHSNPLLFGSGIILAISIFFYHDKDDLKSMSLFLLIGTIIEVVGIQFKIWTYPEPHLFGLPLWFITMWAGAGLFWRRIFLVMVGLKGDSRFQKPGVRSPSPVKVVVFAIKEYFRKAKLSRRPETHLVMEDSQSVEAFTNQGKLYLQSVYHFNATQMDSLIPKDGLVLDLGSGSAEFLIYLAQCRPDIQIWGVEFSDEMIKLGEKSIKERGLQDRIHLLKGDMRMLTAIEGSLLSRKIDLISSIFSLHHLETSNDLSRCFEQIRLLKTKHQCSIWIFDHTRPKSEKTAHEFPELFTPEAPLVFKNDSEASLRAAFTMEEMKDLLVKNHLNLESQKAKFIMPFYQVHFCSVKQHHQNSQNLFRKNPQLNRRDINNAKFLKSLFNEIPNRNCG